MHLLTLSLLPPSLYWCPVSFPALVHKHHGETGLKIIFTLFEREGIKEMFYLQVYNSQGWARLMAEAQNSIQVIYLGGRNPNT